MSAMQSLVECTVMLWGVNGAGLCILAGSRCEHKVGWLRPCRVMKNARRVANKIVYYITTNNNFVPLIF